MAKYCASLLQNNIPVKLTHGVIFQATLMYITFTIPSHRNSCLVHYSCMDKIIVQIGKHICEETLFRGINMTSSHFILRKQHSGVCSMKKI